MPAERSNKPSGGVRAPEGAAADTVTPPADPPAEAPKTEAEAKPRKAKAKAKGSGRYVVAEGRSFKGARGQRNGAGVLGRTEGQPVEPGRDIDAEDLAHLVEVGVIVEV